MQESFLEEIQKNYDYYGPSYETRKAMEEAAEYIQSINKSYCKGACEVQNLIEEMADVLITMEYVKKAYSITDEEIRLATEKKIYRQKIRREREMETNVKRT